MFSNDLLNGCKERIENAKNIAIFSHESVDGDAVACLLSLGKVCEKLGKNVGLFTTSTPGRSYQFLPEIGKIRIDFDYADSWDLIIFVDFTQPEQRIGKIFVGHEQYFHDKETIIVDHHIGGDAPSKGIMLKNVESASCAELLYEITQANRPTLIDADIATYWYLGLTTDTGNFQYEKDSIEIFNHAIELIKLGANKPRIIQNIFNNNERSSIELSKMMIPRITRDQHICYARYAVEEITKMGFDKDEADNVIFSYLRPLKAIPVIVIIRKGLEDKVGMSLRSGYMADGRRIDVQKIAIHFGGGGHMYAAGCKANLEADFIAQVPKLAAEINAEIEKQL